MQNLNALTTLTSYMCIGKRRVCVSFYVVRQVQVLYQICSIHSGIDVWVSPLSVSIIFTRDVIRGNRESLFCWR